jgi:hypothetical protein
MQALEDIDAWDLVPWPAATAAGIVEASRRDGLRCGAT